MPGEDQVAHLGPDMARDTLRMLAGHQLVPDPALLGAADENQHQILHLVDTVEDAGGSRYGLPQTARLTTTATVAGSRQGNTPLRIKDAKRLQAASALLPTASIRETECFAYPVSDRSAMGEALR